MIQIVDTPFDGWVFEDDCGIVQRHLHIPHRTAVEAIEFAGKRDVYVYRTRRTTYEVDDEILWCANAAVILMKFSYYTISKLIVVEKRRSYGASYDSRLEDCLSVINNPSASVWEKTDAEELSESILIAATKRMRNINQHDYLLRETVRRGFYLTSLIKDICDTGISPAVIAGRVVYTIRRELKSITVDEMNNELELKLMSLRR